MSSQVYRVERDGLAVEMEFDARLRVSAHCGEEAPPLGWTSTAYHQRTASTTLAAAGPAQGPQTFVTRMKVLFATELVSQK